MLVTLTETKAYLGITSTATDTLLNTLITYTTADIEAYCDRRLVETTITGEILQYEQSNFDAVRNPVLDVNYDYLQVFLKEYPVTSLVLYNDTVVVDTENYSLETPTGVVTVLSWVNDKTNKFTADYTAGYTTTTGSTYSIPNALKLVALEGVKYAFKASGVVTQGSGNNVTSKSVSSFSVSYSDVSGEIRNYLLQSDHILSRYKRISI